MRETLLLVLLMLVALLPTAHAGSGGPPSSRSTGAETSALPDAGGLAARDHAATLVPVPTCGTGWGLEGEAEVYDPETLSDRINGEAEIFFPYGFEYLSYGRYQQGGKGFDLDVYRMGSLLDAYGIYAGYRPEGGDSVPTGTEGAATSSQLFFYQGRYFVRLQSTGDGDAGREALVSCGREVARLLPPGEGAPEELELLAVPGIERKSIEYKAASLLGYDFLPRGLVADAPAAGDSARVFLVLVDSTPEAASTLTKYRSYLQESGGLAGPPTGSEVAAVSGTDPLYGKVLTERSGRYVYGIVRIKDPAAAAKVMMTLRSRLVPLHRRSGL